jgi:methyl-accepting chemotaxis protein
MDAVTQQNAALVEQAAAAAASMQDQAAALSQVVGVFRIAAQEGASAPKSAPRPRLIQGVGAAPRTQSAPLRIARQA